MLIPRLLFPCVTAVCVMAVTSSAAVAVPHAFAPTPIGPALSSGELTKALDRACELGTVLYVAAHPDDENTHLLSWFVGERNLRAAYVSMTRGGGGQNLIGAEQGELLGLIRTHELLEARKIDGAEQYFTRARDFGYSKTPEETMQIWGKDQALADLVFVIRRARPDVIVTRFPLNGKTHGHHLASAILGAEAFKAAADPKRFPEQLEFVATWQATRIVENKPHWRVKPETDKSGWLALDVGGYDPLLGKSWAEIAAASRSMHKSQGFGSAPRRGVIEYFVPIAGKPYTDDLFSGIDTSWARVAHGAAVGKLLHKAAAELDPRHPERIVSTLVAARTALEGVTDTDVRTYKGRQIDRLILAASGVTLEAKGKTPTAVPSRALPVTLTAVARTAPEGGVVLADLIWSHAGTPEHINTQLAARKPATWEHTFVPAREADYTIPHWLRARPTTANYVIDAPERIGDASDPAPLNVNVTLKIAGRTMNVSVPVEYVQVDPVMGERRRQVQIVPLMTANFDRSVMMVPSQGGEKRTLDVIFKTTVDAAEAEVRFVAPKGVTVRPAKTTVRLAKGGDIKRVTLTVTASKTAQPGELRAEIETVLSDARGARDGAYQAVELDHPHIPQQIVLLPASLRVVPVALKTGGKRVAYVPGSGDRVAESLRQVGYDVEEVTVSALASMHAADLAGFDALVIGVRAYNVYPTLTHSNDTLMDYVKRGGRVIVQYQTKNRFGGISGPLGPATFEIGRGRVTDETAAMRSLDAKHPALTSPNAIGPADWTGWVQERGLYFAKTWDTRYVPLFSANDPGESALTGSTIVADHGRGVFVYTGISFFRQLPAGVPGAYRLFANLLALGPQAAPPKLGR